ncbi:MAG: hypothetical protein ICV66_06880 [Chitinophagaceae bacterium]|nr:hypothetical protein [Chitinophagaceae bacterium]
MRTYVICLFLVIPMIIAGQSNYIDSLKRQLRSTGNDTLRLLYLNELAEEYSETKPDTSLYYAEQAIKLGRKLKLELNEAFGWIYKGYALLNMGNYPRALQASLSAIGIAEDPKSERHIIADKYPRREEIKSYPVTPRILRLDMLGAAHHFTAIVYGNAGNYDKELYHYMQAKEYGDQVQNPYHLSTVFMTLGRLYLSLKKPDSALYYEQKAYDLVTQIGYKKYMGSILLNLARTHLAKGNRLLATEYFRRAIDASYEQKYMRGVVAGNLALADIFKQAGRLDSGLHYVNTALSIAEDLDAPNLLLRCYTALAAIYRTINNKDSTVKYQELIIKLNDSLFNSRQVQQFQNIDFDEQQRRQEMEAAREAFQFRLKVYALLTGLAAFLLIAIILWRTNKQRKKANALLHKQNEELQSTLKTLETTQKQLIQSEKMASLGELTAGIAHEIQNPLNFVNNFSEVNTELIEEMINELREGNYQQAIAIANSINENEEKISFHGKRADGIVKSMLQHSRASTGKKEPTDINALTDEYLRLSYHGLKAKEKSFNCTVKTHFDSHIGAVNVIPQDMGRVLLNLFTNAFHSVSEKKKHSNDSYEPAVLVSTKISNGHVEIRVKDNGIGIPQKVLDKIFQPFFTTKPTGQGTGLGLSMSYDIIKVHGGDLKVETKEGEYAEFTVQLPAG